MNERIDVVCNSESTRYGFRHLATLFVDGKEYSKAKCTYQNRTYESFEFQSVLHKVISDSSLPVADKLFCESFIENYKDSDNSIGLTMNIAKLGDVFCNTQKEKNDWKLRMLKAGLESKGLMIPTDWESLTEEQKEIRLNAVLQVAQ